MIKNKDIKLFLIFMIVATIVSIIFRIPFNELIELELKISILVLSGIVLGLPIAFILSFIICIIETVFVSFSGFIGFITNLASTWIFICFTIRVFGLLKPSLKNLGICCFASSLFNSIMMFLYYKLIFSSIPNINSSELIFDGSKFILIKCIINSIFILLLYKPILNIDKKYNILDNFISKFLNNKLMTLIMMVISFSLVALPIVLLLIK